MNLNRLQDVLIFVILLTLMTCRTAQVVKQAPTPTIEPKSLAEQAQDIAKEIIITDGHIDIPYRLRSSMEDVSKATHGGDFDYPRAVKGGLNAPFMSIYIPASFQVTGGAKGEADELIDIVKDIVSKAPSKFAMASTPAQVYSNFENGLISLPMGMENGAPIEDDLDNVAYYREQGISYITLTHGKDNQISDSSYDTTRTWKGLSPFGFDVVGEMNKQGIMVDVSHISDDAFYQVMTTSKAPVIASHSSCRAFTPGFERNMSDEMLKVLATNDGVIQINFGSTFIDSASQRKSKMGRAHIRKWLKTKGLNYDDEKAQKYIWAYNSKIPIYSDVSVVADHIDHVVQLVGVDHVGFGSDFDGVGDSLPEGLKDVSMYPNLILQLLERGYSREDIEKICYKNVFRVWSRVIDVSEAMKG